MQNKPITMTKNTKLLIGAGAIALTYVLIRNSKKSKDSSYSNLTGDLNSLDAGCRKKCGIKLKKDIPFFSLERLLSIFKSDKLTPQQEVCYKLCNYDKTQKLKGGSPFAIIGGEFEAGLGLIKGAGFYLKESGSHLLKDYTFHKGDELLKK